MCKRMVGCQSNARIRIMNARIRSRHDPLVTLRTRNPLDGKQIWSAFFATLIQLFPNTSSRVYIYRLINMLILYFGKILRDVVVNCLIRHVIVQQPNNSSWDCELSQFNWRYAAIWNKFNVKIWRSIYTLLKRRPFQEWELRLTGNSGSPCFHPTLLESEMVNISSNRLQQPFPWVINYGHSSNSMAYLLCLLTFLFTGDPEMAMVIVTGLYCRAKSQTHSLMSQKEGLPFYLN